MASSVVVDAERLRALGVGLPSRSRLELDAPRLAMALVEERVGELMMAELADAQVEEFGELLDRGEEVDGWLELQVPHLTQVVRSAVEELEAAIADDPEGFLEAVERTSWLAACP